MNFDELNLDALHPLLPLPLWQKLVGLAGIVVVVLGLYVYLSLMPLIDEIHSQEAQVTEQKKQLLENQRLAGDLPRKREEFARLEVQLKAALSMLPKKSQIPDLLESVSRAGTDSGLEFAVFTPKNERGQPLYAEVPVDVNMMGTFRQFLTFLKRVGELPRIVAVKNLELGRGSDADVVMIKGNVLTYRFVDQSAKSSKKKKKKVRGR